MPTTLLWKTGRSTICMSGFSCSSSRQDGPIGDGLWKDPHCWGSIPTPPLLSAVAVGEKVESSSLPVSQSEQGAKSKMLNLGHLLSGKQEQPSRKSSETLLTLFFTALKPRHCIFPLSLPVLALVVRFPNHNHLPHLTELLISSLPFFLVLLLGSRSSLPSLTRGHLPTSYTSFILSIICGWVSKQFG